MKTFYQMSENYGYNPHIDGPPLTPHTMSAAETQIYSLARNIRTTFGMDEQFRMHQDKIYQAIKLLEEAAEILGGIKDRHQTHRFHR